MMAFLQALHPIAAKRGDGLRHEFLRRQIEDVLNLNLPDNQPALAGLAEEEGITTMKAMIPRSNRRR
ncbi:hypothetical protein [Mesorhizobium sp. B2-8-9]|uniref:hypothetical protein n=1 Tax=Mesorhizobium sp. B2-8-9 TaxID=2589899 RepID=UPI00112D3087|nr:hypothetical protein [Mesorhizobium sp. B2-8-9]TPI78479.1 hypothetical protein FJ423_16320 [Mesorhizobium sp. B2-8-9]